MREPAALKVFAIPVTERKRRCIWRGVVRKPSPRHESALGSFFLWFDRIDSANECAAGYGVITKSLTWEESSLKNPVHFCLVVHDTFTSLCTNQINNDLTRWRNFRAGRFRQGVRERRVCVRQPVRGFSGVPLRCLGRSRRRLRVQQAGTAGGELTCKVIVAGGVLARKGGMSKSSHVAGTDGVSEGTFGDEDGSSPDGAGGVS